MIDHLTRRRNLKNSTRWTAADIRAEIIRRGSTPSRVAEAAGLSARAGRAAIASPRYVRAKIALAAFLGLHPSEIWLGRYAPGSQGLRSPARQKAAGCVHLKTTGRAA